MARMRTFIAVDLAEEVRDRVIVLQEKLARAGPDVKWVEAENLHFTLLFLGEVIDRAIPDVCRAVAQSCHALSTFTVSVAGAGCFPSPRRPRVIWIGAGEGKEELIALHDALEPPLLELGCYRREARQFTPHITLGRVKSELATDALAKALTKYANWDAGAMQVREVRVMSSELTSGGPEYTVLSRVRLK